MHYIGLISGTSVDAVDAALVSLRAGARPILVATHAHPIDAALRSEIQSLMREGPNEIDRFGELDMALGELFAQAALEVLKLSALAKKDVRAIGSHGQTLRHRPTVPHPFSLQVGNPSVIAERTGITTVADFRARDMAAGGQGAPMVPAFHHHAFHAPQRNRLIVNIGGIANLTFLPGDAGQPVIGFDTGPGNTLLDRWIGEHQSQARDDGGQWAARGRSAPELLEVCLADSYFKAAPPKSTGREYFNREWLEACLKRCPAAPAPVDVQATLLELTAASIVQAARAFLPRVQEVYVCGGGAHNGALMASLARHWHGTPVTTTEQLGLAPDWVEAAAFAWLAHQALERLPGNLPSVTGAARAVILGGIYPSV